MDGPLRYRNVTDSHQLDEPTYLQHRPWEQLPYECRIDWTREGTEILQESSIEYIYSQPDDNTYYTDGSSDVHKEEEIIIKPIHFASVLDAEMTAIPVALENASKPRDKITINTDSLTVINILNNRKMNLNTITRAIGDAASRLTQEVNY